MGDAPFVKRGSGKFVPEDRVYTQRELGEELGTDGKPKSVRQVQRLTEQGSLGFLEKTKFKNWGPPMYSAIAQSLWAAGEKFDIAVGSAHAGAAQNPRPNRKKRSEIEVDTPPGGGTSAIDVSEIPKK